MDYQNSVHEFFLPPVMPIRAVVAPQAHLPMGVEVNGDTLTIFAAPDIEYLDTILGMLMPGNIRCIRINAALERQVFVSLLNRMVQARDPFAVRMLLNRAQMNTLATFLPLQYVRNRDGTFTIHQAFRVEENRIILNPNLPTLTPAALTIALQENLGVQWIDAERISPDVFVAVLRQIQNCWKPLGVSQDGESPTIVRRSLGMRVRLNDGLREILRAYPDLRLVVQDVEHPNIQGETLFLRTMGRQEVPITPDALERAFVLFPNLRYIRADHCLRGDTFRYLLRVIRRTHTPLVATVPMDEILRNIMQEAIAHFPALQYLVWEPTEAPLIANGALTVHHVDPQAIGGVLERFGEHIHTVNVIAPRGALSLEATQEIIDMLGRHEATYAVATAFNHYPPRRAQAHFPTQLPLVAERGALYVGINDTLDLQAIERTLQGGWVRSLEICRPLVFAELKTLFDLLRQASFPSLRVSLYLTPEQEQIVRHWVERYSALYQNIELRSNGVLL